MQVALEKADLRPFLHQKSRSFEPNRVLLMVLYFRSKHEVF